MTRQNLTNEQIEGLLVAVLAVNSFPLERAWDLLPALRKAQLHEPPFVIKCDTAALTVALANAGYNRGTLTGLFAERVRSLMLAIDSGQLNELPKLLKSNQYEDAAELLCKVPGVGKKVSANAMMLLTAVARIHVDMTHPVGGFDK